MKMDLPPSVDIGLDYDHACVVAEQHDVTCWSLPLPGGSFNPWPKEPTVVAHHAISVDRRARALLMQDGTLRVVGMGGDSGRFVPSASGATGITLVDDWLCAVKTGGTATCGPKTLRAIRQLEMSLEAGSSSGCSVLDSGTVVCWENETKAMEVRNINQAKQVCVGRAHACAVTKDGGVSCWGDNSESQLGIAIATTKEAVSVLSPAHSAKAVFCGPEQTCAILADESALCWGRNTHHQLGPGPAWWTQPTPYVVKPVTVMAMNEKLSCAIVGGLVTCVGGE